MTFMTPEEWGSLDNWDRVLLFVIYAGIGLGVYAIFL